MGAPGSAKREAVTTFNVITATPSSPPLYSESPNLWMTMSVFLAPSICVAPVSCTLAIGRALGTVAAACPVCLERETQGTRRTLSLLLVLGQLLEKMTAKVEPGGLGEISQVQRGTLGQGNNRNKS